MAYCILVGTISVLVQISQSELLVHKLVVGR